jgi:hypothetical protein
MILYNLGHLILWWAILVIVVEAITEILVDAEITNGFRFSIKKWAYPIVEEGQKPVPPAWYKTKLAYLVTCGYCTSVWVAGAFAFFAPPTILGYWPHRGERFIDWVIATAVLHRLSNWLHVLFMLVKKGRVKTHDILFKVDDGSTGQSQSTGSTEDRPEGGEGSGSTLVV